MPITVNSEMAQANLLKYLNDLDAGTLDKVIVIDNGAAYEIVSYARYRAADPGAAAEVEHDLVTAYTGSPAVCGNSLYRLVKRMRDRQFSVDTQKAVAVITPVDGAHLIDAETVTLTDAGGITKVLEMDSNAATAPGNIPVVFTAADLQPMVADALCNAINANTEFTAVIRSGTGLVAAGSITPVDGAHLVDAETVTITSALGVASVFEFDSDANSLPGSVTVGFLATNPQPDIADTLRIAINTVGPHSFTATARAGTGIVPEGSIEVVDGAHLLDGETFTITNAEGTVTVFEFDSNAAVVAGNVAVTFTAADTVAVVGAAVRDAILGVAGFNVLASGPVDAVVALRQSNGGVTSNVAITHTVADAGFVCTGFVGGTDVVLDIVQHGAGAAGNVAITDTVVDAGFVCTGFAGGVDAQVALTQESPGASGNVAISHTVADAGFVTAGFGGGTNVMSPIPTVIVLSNSKNDAHPRAALVPSGYAAIIGL
jgi:hypothetical protein